MNIHKRLKAYHPINYGTVRVKRMGNIDRIVSYWGESYIGEKKHSDKCSVNNEKLDNNLIRAKGKIKEYALCNDWEYFVTLTIDKNKHDRYNLKQYKQDISKFINNFNTNNNCRIKYLFIPEFHDDGAVHMHGLLCGLSNDYLVINKYGYLDWPAYHKSFGYISLSAIRDKTKVAYYITKYITKDLIKHKTELGSHLYLCSKGLKKGEVIYEAETDLKVWNYENEFCKIAEIDNSKEDYTDYINM